MSKSPRLRDLTRPNGSKRSCNEPIAEGMLTTRPSYAFVSKMRMISRQLVSRSHEMADNDIGALRYIVG